MLHFTPAYFVSDESNLAKKNCSCERALTIITIFIGNYTECRPLEILSCVKEATREYSLIGIRT